ncbi:hypothetical protein BJ508DRAFT_376940 [Ascobolus immersus RN42]|uniref:RING-type domain-containing protein n=1 Tax=Ascobolus immersus RN42 TaxID=1160509 RepID=A0A3N4I3T3_ASCIM|nr:hypothetical protein BJ508DRAFT_376940 [Ascobolus immersus RN42]
MENDGAGRRNGYNLASLLNPTPPTHSMRPRQPSARPAASSSNVEVVDLTDDLAGPSVSSRTTATNRLATEANESRKRRRTPQQQEEESARRRPRTEVNTNETTVIDLSDTEESSSEDEEEGADAAEKARQEELTRLHKEASERTKLADFKCAVCLDDPTDLSTTPCGHLFCDKCVRQALKAGQPETTKFGHCPICRTKVNLNKITVLEIKLGRRRDKGKEKESL